MTEDLPPANMAANLAVQTVQLQHMRESLERIETSLGTHVTRNEWEMRNGYVDGQFALHATETGALRQSLREAQVAVKERFEEQDRALQSRRAPWWTIVSVVVAAVSLGWIIFGPTIIALP
jgi:hypothetical protein